MSNAVNALGSMSRRREMARAPLGDFQATPSSSAARRCRYETITAVAAWRPGGSDQRRDEPHRRETGATRRGGEVGPLGDAAGAKTGEFEASHMSIGARVA